MKPMKVRGVFSHHAMHNDELLALWFALMFGTKVFLGIRTAALFLVDSGIRLLHGLTGAQWFAKGYPCLGTCGGPLDEHDLPAESRGTSSAATLMANMLGIANFGPIKKMLEHAVRVDRSATASGFDISALIKAWHRINTPIDRVRRMFDRSTEARFNVLSGRIRNQHWAKRPDLNRLAAEWILTRYSRRRPAAASRFTTGYAAAKHLGICADESLGPILEYLQSGAHDPSYVFGLAGTVQAMNQDGADLTDVRDFVFWSLDAKAVEQQRFLKGYDHLRSLNEAGELYINEGSLRIIAVTSENSEINRAARLIDKHADAFIQRSTDGHVVVWYNRKLNMDGAVARLRIGDLIARKMPHLPWEVLTAEGTVPEAPWWYYNPANGQVMCGSLTNRGTPVTLLDNSAIASCLVDGVAAAQAAVREKVPA